MLESVEGGRAYPLLLEEVRRGASAELCRRGVNKLINTAH
jgi:hypothetical protein